ncbi:MAG: choice-of-anchor L domain-containing protein [bacterium]|nr:choice-of-anchor L domain-containing protein [bacterium]
MKKFLLAVAFIVANVSASFSQLLVSNSLTPSQLAQLITGPGVQIFNPVIHCGLNGYGSYNAVSSNLNITQGLLLTTGKITNAIGPNDSTNTTWYFGNKTNPNTYTLLNSYTGRTTYEYCEFEFDIIPQGDSIKFDFVFASEEYQEWVGSQYNDVFGFFISGPGITGDAGAGAYHNIALLPNGSTPVTINNVNQNTNTGYYQNNNNGTTVEYDGFTKGLKAISKVTPCQIYHLKLVVADVSDKLWDSGVFIEKISSNNVILLSRTAGGISNMVEGCNYGTVIFDRQVSKPTALSINYWLGGTATNGTDYPLIGSSPAPINPKTIVIPANQTTVGLNIAPFADGIIEGSEYLTVYLGNPMCANQITDSLRFFIQDSLFTTVLPANDSICIGQIKTIVTTGGGSAFSWLPAAALNSVSISSPIASPTVTTIYTLATTASSCVMVRKSKINVSNIALSFTPTNVACNGFGNGAVNLGVAGGFPNYSYQWNSSTFTSTLQNINGLAPGVYSVNVTGKKGCSRTGTVAITQPVAITATLASPSFNGGFNVSCNGGNSGSANSILAGGTAPYSYTWTTSPPQLTANAGTLSGGTYSLTIKDANNCLLTKTITLTQPLPITVAIASQQNVLCYGNATGAGTLNTSGGTAPYSYTWSTVPAQSSSIATNLSAANYTVSVRDANNCSAGKTLTITQPLSALSASISSLVNIACFGNSTGSASLSAQGGSTPYTYTWNTSPVQTNAQAVNLGAGNYAGTIKDANNCSVSLPINISQPASNVSAVISNLSPVSCFGGNNGSVTVLPSGGVPAYTYSWNTVPSQTNATAVNLVVGTYIVTIKDQNNCSYAMQTIITQPAAALIANISSQTNVLCFGSSTGGATGSASGGTSPYNYAWSTSPQQTNASAMNLSVGFYTLNVLDAHNCNATQTVSISQPSSAVSAYISSKLNVYCFGSSSGSAAVTAVGGVAPYTYSWTSSPPQNLSVATGLAAGNYTVTVKDANNCMTFVSVNISQPLTAFTASISATSSVLCKGNSTGSSTVLASGGSGSYSYLWNSVPSQTTAIATSLNAGNYTVIVTDKNGCSIPVLLPITVSEPTASLSASGSSPLFNGFNIACFAGTNGSINLVPSGGTFAYTFAWAGPNGFSATSEDLTNLSAGTYSVLITDANSCAKNYSITLSQPNSLSMNSTITPATCGSFSNGAIDLNVSGGSPAYSYLWNGPSGYTANVANISSLGAGSYSLNIVDLNGCVREYVVTVTQPGAIVITNSVSNYPGGNNISCFGYNNGSIGSVSVSGGSPGYSYTWSGPGAFSSTSQNISSLYAGLYQLIVLDANGCTASKTVNVSEPSLISRTLSPSTFAGGHNIDCHGANTGSVSTVVTGGTPVFTYAWFGPGSFSSLSQNVVGLQGGSYTLVVQDINSCTGTSTIQLSQPSTLTVSATSPTFAGGFNASCNGYSDAAIILNTEGGTTGYSYLWSGPLGFTSTAQNQTGLAAGAYSVVVTDTNSCTSSTSLFLTSPGVLLTSIASPTNTGGYNISCYSFSNAAITLTVSGGASPFVYSWTGTSAFTSSLQNLTGVSAGGYSVSVIDANGCSTFTNITLTQPLALTSSISSPTVGGNYNITCHGAANGSITLNASGGTPSYTYAWTGPSGYTNNVQHPLDVQPGTYSCITIDKNGCTTSSSITLTEPSVLSINLSSPSFAGGYNISCHGNSNGSINLQIDGGTPPIGYLWNGPSGYSNTIQNPSGLLAGSYTVVVTDLNACASSSVITLTQPQSIAGSINSFTYGGGFNISCFGYLNGSITQTLSGGTLPYSIIWSNGAITQNISNVGSGMYSVIINDINNCSITQTINLTEPEALFATGSSPSFYGGYNIKCHGTSTGTINLGSSGGLVPYSYNWSGPALSASTQDLSNVPVGIYSVTITDLNACTYSTSVTLTEPASLLVTLNSATFSGGYNASCNGSNNASISSTVSGGTQTYQYLWNGSSGFTSTAAFVYSLSPGNYTLFVTDTNQCNSSSTILLSQPLTLTATANSTVYAGGYNITCNGLNNGEIHLIIGGGSPVYTFLWIGPDNFTASIQNITGLVAGTYSAIITDANGCRDSVVKFLSEPSGISDTMSHSIFIGGRDISCYGAADGTIQLNTFGGVSPYSILWSGPGSFNSNATSLNSLFAGSYNVLISDQNGCTKNDSIKLLEPLPLSQTLTTTHFVGGYNIHCKYDSSGVIRNNVTGGTAGYSYNWSGPGGFSAYTKEINNVYAGNYTLTVIDTNGCTKTNSMMLTEPSVALTASVIVTPVLCNGDSTGAIDLSYAGGTPGFSIWWRGPNQFTSSQQKVTNLIAGNYFLVLKDTNGCDVVIDTLIPQPILLTFSYVATNPLCGGINTGSIDVTVSGGTSPFTYSWSNSATSQDIVGLGGGTYTLVVNDANSCSASGTMALIQPPLLTATAVVTSDYNGQQIRCYGLSNGSAISAASGGTGSYSYLWSTTPSQTTAASFSLSAGTYTLLVKDINNCTVTETITLTQPAALTSTVAVTSNYNGQNISCNGSSDGSASVTHAGGTVPYVYNWSTLPTQTLAAAIGLSAGSYTVLITDINNCSITNTIALNQPAAVTSTVAVTSNYNGKQISCFGAADGSATITANNGTAPYTYTWSTVPPQTGTLATGFSAGTYSIIVTDINNCAITKTISLAQPLPLTSTVSVVSNYNGQQVSCFGLSNGAASVNVNGGSTPYTYTWSTVPSQHATTASSLSAGIYTVSVKDINGCAGTNTILLNQPTLVSASASVTSNYNGQQISCHGLANGSAFASSVGGTGAHTYSWSSTPSQINAAAINLAAGTYTVFVKDANNCAATQTVTLTQPVALSNTAVATSLYNGQNISCHGYSDGSASVTVAGGTSPFIYAWNTIPSQTTFTAGNMVAGMYSVVVTDINNCASTATVTLTQAAELTATVFISSNFNGSPISCYGAGDGAAGIIVSDGTAPYTYTWSTVPVQTGTLAMFLSAGNYSILIADNNGCVTIRTVSITQPLPLVSSIAPLSNYGGYDISCAGLSDGSASVTLVGGIAPYTYTWSTLPAQNASTASSLSAGSYTVNIKDLNGCFATNTISLSEPFIITGSVVGMSNYNGYHVSCFGSTNGYINIAITGGVGAYSYTWSNSANTQNINNLGAGTYSVLVNDENACEGTLSVTVNQPPQLIVGLDSLSNYNGFNVSCFGAANALVYPNVTGGVPAYSFQWSNGSTSPTLTGVGQGNYSLTITDKNNCVAQTFTSITEPTVITFTSLVTNPLCNGVSNGAINFTNAGGVSPYTYKWSNGATTGNISGLSAGSYTVVYTDKNKCSNTAFFGVIQPQTINLIKDVKTIKCYGDVNGSIALTLIGGTTPYSYIWSNGVTTKNLNGIDAGVYIVKVTDKNNCELKDSTIISQPDPLKVTVYSPVQTGGYNVSAPQANDGFIDITVIGGVIPYSYLWSNSQTSEDLYNIPAGPYNVLVSDMNGCKVSAALVLTEPLILEMPTGFSPNWDGQNDYFVVHGIEVYPNNELVILNRWGNVVFNKKGYTNDWYGLSNDGADLAGGTYFAILKINGGEIVLKGYVELRR